MVGFVAASNLNRNEDAARWSRCHLGTASVSPAGRDPRPRQTRPSRGAGTAESPLHPQQRIAADATQPPPV